MKIDKEQVSIRYSNRVAILIDMMKPANLYLLGGRGTGKSTDILANRFIDVMYDMPGAPFAWVADTYMNLMTNIIPEIKMAWESRHDFFENYHYVIDKEPPPHFKKAGATFNYKHTIITCLGNKVFLKSLDRPSINAGISVVHLFGDEAKYMKESSLRKLNPTLRGDIVKYGKSPFFMGQTFVSDMPDLSVGEHDWMYRMKKRMDPDKITMIVQAARILNEVNLELYQAETINADPRKIELIRNKQGRWEERCRKVRYGSTFFHVVSSFANVDVLTIKYLQTQMETLTPEEFKLVILSIKKEMEAGAKFYANLTNDHFYNDEYDYDYYDAAGYQSNITRTSAGLRHVNPDMAIEAGFDAGNMMSLVFGQEQGDTYRVFKNIYTISPDWIRELANKFLSFFATHKKKFLILYYDRAANNYNKSRNDFASNLKHDIENDGAGKRTGWIVQLMSVGQGNIAHAEKYHLMNVLMSGKERRLPKLRIATSECKELKSELEICPVEKDKTGQIKKVKKGDKLQPLSRLPLESTNLTDAFDYLLCRRKWMAIVKQRGAQSFGSLNVR